MTDLEIAKTLKDAAQYIRDHGWIRAAGMDAEGHVCGLGAINSVVAEGQWTSWTASGTRGPMYHLLRRNAAVVAFSKAVAAVAHSARAKCGLKEVSDDIDIVWSFNDFAVGSAEGMVDAFESVALQHELRALAVTTLSHGPETLVCDNTVPEAVNA